jgi:predicted MFS family arabinose efflux permease
MFFMVVLAAAGAIPYLFLREPPQERGALERPPPLSRIAQLFAQLLIPDVVLAFGLGAILTFIQLYFHLEFGLEAGPVGFIMAAGGLIAGVATLLTPILARRWGNLRSTVRFQALAVPLMIMLALAPTLATAIPAYWAVLILRGMSDPVYTAFVQERVPEMYRARLTGFYSVTYAIGYSLGPAASGQLQNMSGFTVAFLMGAACYLLGASLLYVFFARKRHRESESLGREVSAAG